MEQQQTQTATKTLSPIPLFPLGQVVATPAVLAHLTAHGISAREYLQRHQHGDWGDVPPEDAVSNSHAVRTGARIISAYVIAGAKIWILTEAGIENPTDRCATTLLFPAEY